MSPGGRAARCGPRPRRGRALAGAVSRGLLGPGTWTDPDSGRVSQTLGPQSVCAGLEAAAAFWWRLYCEARRRGLGAAPVALVVVLGDGADWIWHAAARFLALRGVELVEIVGI